MADLRYAVILEPEPDGSAFNVIVSAFPEVHTFGATVEEAVAMACEAIELSLEYLRDKGLEIPASHADVVRLEHVSVTYPAA
jgi:predicted RNase H-like HicB family nuclease